MLNDENSSHLLYFNCALRWFALRMDVLMNIVTFIVSLMVTLSFFSVSASSKGLSLSYIIQVPPGVGEGLAWRLSQRVREGGGPNRKHSSNGVSRERLAATSFKGLATEWASAVPRFLSCIRVSCSCLFIFPLGTCLSLAVRPFH